MKKALLTLLFIAHLTIVFSQATGYKITMIIDGYTDTTGYLGSYYGDKLAVVDTAQAMQGKLTFTGEEPLGQGVYFFATQDKKKSFEFLIDEDQIFTMKTIADGMPSDMSVKGSDENNLFYEYLVLNKKTYDEARVLQERMKSLPKDSDSIDIIRDQLEVINERSINYKLQLMEENPGTIIGLLFSLMREPEVPDFFLDNGRQDSLASYLYYKNHYWDGVSFSDDRLLRTPVFHQKLERYMDQVVQKHPDSIITAIDTMIVQTAHNSEMREYLLWYFTHKYEVSKIMGYDRIFVYLVDKYFTDQSYEWLHPTVQQNLLNRVNILRNVLIGEFAPTLIMADTNNKFIALHEVVAEFTIVLFWTTTCGECKREVNTLKEFYNETPLDLKIYAVNTDTSLVAWKKYLIQKDVDWLHVNGNISMTGDYHDLYDIYSTPVIYVLDKNKKIIAKRLPAKNIPGFLRRYVGKEYEN